MIWVLNSSLISVTKMAAEIWDPNVMTNLGIRIFVGQTLWVIMWRALIMTPSNRNIFRVTGSSWRESTGHWWILPHVGQWRRALMFSLICVWTNGWANNWDTSDLRRHRVHYDVIVINNHTKSTPWVKSNKEMTLYRIRILCPKVK